LIITSYAGERSLGFGEEKTGLLEGLTLNSTKKVRKRNMKTF